MTKLKTKKGKPIAKRTLSVILAAAMVLSSNSLVWANVETEPQAEVEAAVEAPAEEVTTDEIDVAADEIKCDAKLGTFEWDDDLKVEGTLTVPAGTEVYYIVQDEDGLAVEGALAGPMGDLSLSQLAWPMDEEWVNKAVRVHFYTLSEDGKETWSYDTNYTTIQPVDVTGKYVLKFNSADSRQYTGEPIKLTPNVVVNNANDNPFAGPYEFTYSGDLVNAGSTVTVTGVPTDDKLYTGHIYGTYEIAKREINATNIYKWFDATIKAGTEYDYTGFAPEVKASDIKLEAIIGDTKVDVSNAIKEVTVESNAGIKNAGDYELTRGKGVYVTLDADALSNYELKNANRYVTGEFEIAPLDLSTVKVNFKPMGANLALTSVNDYIEWAMEGGYANGFVSYTNAAGDKVEINDDVTITSVDQLKTGHIGNYKATVAKKTDNVKNTTTANVVITEDDLRDAAFTGTEALTAEEYTGSAIEKTAKQLGTLKDGDDKELVLNRDYTIRYENNVNAGKASLIVEGIAGTRYENCVKVFNFTINQAVLDVKLSSAAKTVLYDIDNDEAEDYAEDMAITVKAKNAAKPAQEFTVDSTDYTVEYTFKNAGEKNKLGNYVVATITAKDKTNFKGSVTLESQIGLPAPEITLEKDSYVYTGAPIVPEIKVTLDGVTLKEDKDYTVSITNGTNVGTATVEVVGAGKYENLIKGEETFEITKANAEDVTVEFDEEYVFTGEKIEPEAADVTVKLGDVDVSKQFDVTYPGENINAGKEAGTILLTPTRKAGDKNFEGTKEAAFEIKPAELKGKLRVYDENGKEYTVLPGFEYDGNAQTFAKTGFKVADLDGDLEDYVTEDDYEIVYANNIEAGVASVFVIGKNNFAGAGEDIKDNRTETTYKSVVAGTEKNFTITGGYFNKGNITVERTVEYGQGVSVVPTVKVVKNGITLKEGVDYKVEITKGGIEVGKNNEFKVVGINGFNNPLNVVEGYDYEIVAKDLANCEIIATADDVTVMNGDVVVPSSEYTVKDNGDGTVTVTAKESSKNYTGSAKAQIVESSNQVLDVVAKPYTKTKIHVTWRNIKGADSYVIYKDGVKIADAEDGKEGYIDGGMHSYDGIYEYQVAAVFNGKEGEKSDIYESTTRPADPVVNNAFTHKNGIRVETKAKGAEGYRVWIRQGGSNPTEYVEKKSTYGNYTFKDLKNGQKYVIKVQAYKLVNGKKVPSRNVVYVTGKAETAKKSLI